MPNNLFLFFTRADIPELFSTLVEILIAASTFYYNSKKNRKKKEEEKLNKKVEFYFDENEKK